MDIILAFLEYLVDNSLSVANICNYLAALRTMFIIHNLPTHPFRDEKIQMFVKSDRINRPLVVKTNSIFTKKMLLNIMAATETLEFSEIFLSIYLLAFFSFLRLSNIVPHAKNGFDPSRHLARGDIIFSDNEAIVLVKWSKTIQSRDKVARVVIPKLPGSKLCPVSALSNMLHLVPGSNNDPLFAIFKANQWSPLTDSMVRKHLKRVLLLLQLQHHNFTFHTFRRSGASWAFEHGVPIEVIKQQGTWSSNCVWRYIQKSNSSTSPLTQAFQLHLLP